MKTKLFSLALALLMSVPLFAQNGTCGENLLWTLQNGILTISGSGNMYNYNNSAPWYSYRQSITSVTIRNSVTSIGNSAFSGCSGLTSIVIPNSVTSIENYAFRECTNLSSITIPQSVINVSPRAFNNCDGLSSIIVEAGNTKYDSRNNCNAIIETSTNELILGCQNTTIPNTVTSIGECAFYGRNTLSSIVLPNTVTNIGDCAFAGCSNLSSIMIPNGVKKIGSGAFGSCGLRSIIIPSNVTSIGLSAFKCDSLTTVTIHSDSITSKTTQNGNKVFSYIFGLQVKEYILGDEITTIGDYAFRDCQNMRYLTIGKNVVNIASTAFYNTGTLTVTIESNIILNNRTLGTALNNNALHVILGDNITSIEPNALRDCHLSIFSITIGKNVTNIDKGLLDYDYYYYGYLTYGKRVSCTLSVHPDNPKYDSRNECNAIIETSTNKLLIGNRKTIIPNTVTSIGDNAFYSIWIGNRFNSSPTFSITIPPSVTSIEEDAFAECDLLDTVYISDLAAWCRISFLSKKSNPIYSGYEDQYKYHLYLNGTEVIDLVVPDGVTSIGKYAFMGFNYISSITIPNSVTSIGDWAFVWCTGLTSVTCFAVTPPNMGSIVFGGVNSSSVPLYVPAQSVAAYRAADQWKDFHPILAIGTEKATYTVTFKDWNGTILKTEEVEEGNSATPPANPTRNGYTFIGWDSDYTNITSDLTIFAHYRKNTPGDGPIVVSLDPMSSSSWSTVYLWAWTSNGNLFDAWPGIIINKDKEGWYSYQFDENIKNVNIIWNNGTDQTIDITNVTESTCYALNSTSGRTITVSIVDCPLTEDIEETAATNNSSKKIIQNGQLYILLPDGTRYDAIGRRIQ